MMVGLRAADGYNPMLSLADVRAYRMIVATRMDGHPLALGGLGPQWAVYDADRLPAFKDKPLKERFELCTWVPVSHRGAQGVKTSSARQPRKLIDD